MDRRILVVAALAFGGCSIRLDTKDLDPLDSVEPFCQTLFDAFLTHERDCTGWTQQLVDYEYDGALRLCAGIAWSESQGRVGYDRAAAEACLAEVRHVPCTANAERAIADACAAAIPGTRPDGADCYDDVECADPAASCAFVMPACPGTCLAPGKGGDKCGAGYPSCATGFYCDGLTSRCATALAEGATCTGVAATSCGENAFCSGTTGKCVRYAMEGQACSADKPCGATKDARLFCDEYNSFDGGPRVCRRPMTVPVGGYCESSEECDLAGYCSAGAPGTCVPRLGASSPCFGDSMCARPLACVGDTIGAVNTNGVCAPRLPQATLCEPQSADCQIGDACMQSGPGTYVCQPWPAQIDGACGPHPAEKFCYVGQCVGTTSPVCKPWLQIGDPCTSDDACGSVAAMGAPRCAMTAANPSSPVCVPSCLAR